MARKNRKKKNIQKNTYVVDDTWSRIEYVEHDVKIYECACDSTQHTNIHVTTTQCTR